MWIVRQGLLDGRHHDQRNRRHQCRKVYGLWPVRCGVPAGSADFEEGVVNR